MRDAIKKLERRLRELESLDPSTVHTRSDPVFQAAELKIEDTLVEVFGSDSLEYERFRVGSLDRGPIIVGDELELYEIREAFADGLADAKTKLTTAVELLKEKLGDEVESPGMGARASLGGRNLQPEIERAAVSLFRGGHYANAVEDACKALDALVKMRSGRYELSGTELMQTVFSPKKPILRFNDLATETDRSEQQGLMQLYAGAMLAFRNPRAHQLIEDHPETALEMISLISFLARSLDRATRVE